MDGQVKEWMNEIKNERMNEWMSEWMESKESDIRPELTHNFAIFWELVNFGLSNLAITQIRLIITWAAYATRTHTVLEVFSYGGHVGGHFGGNLHISLFSIIGNVYRYNIWCRKNNT